MQADERTSNRQTAHGAIIIVAVILLRYVCARTHAVLACADDLLPVGPCPPGLQLIHTEECPFLIREHVRKYQWGCSHVTVWQLTTKTA